MTAYYILHVEDDDQKARAVQRMLKRSLDSTEYTGLAYMREIQILRAYSLDEARSVLACETPADDVLVGVVTDWQIPEVWDQAPDGKNGAAVVGLCRAQAHHTLVVSGAERPEYFEDTELVRWAPALDLQGALRTFASNVTQHVMRLARQELRAASPIVIDFLSPPVSPETLQRVRDALATPSDPDDPTMHADYSELEKRALAMLGVKEGEDPHEAIARTMFGKKGGDR